MGINRVQLAEGQEQLVSFGPRDVRDIPYDLIIPLSQIRQEYSAIELDELAETMEGIGSEQHRFELINSETIAMLDEDHMPAYMADLNEAWGTEYDWQTFPCMVDEQGVAWYFPLIAGHRRNHAIDHKLTKNGIDRADAVVSASIKQNIGFEEAFILQFRENYATLRPPAADEARGIEAFYRFLQRHSSREKVTAAACARKLGCSDDKVRSALKFMKLPEAVRGMAHHALPYGVVVALADVYDEYVRYYNSQLSDSSSVHSRDGMQEFSSPAAIAGYETQTYAHTLVARSIDNAMRSSSERLEKMVRAHAEMLRIRYAGEQGELELLMEEETPLAKRRRVSQKLFKTTLSALEILLRDPSLSEDMRRQLGGVAAAAVRDEAESERTHLQDALLLTG